MMISNMICRSWQNLHKGIVSKMHSTVQAGARVEDGTYANAVYQCSCTIINPATTFYLMLC